MAVLAINGLEMPPDFPANPFEHTYARLSARTAAHPSYVHFVGAWNAISFRFRTMVDEGDAFTASITHPNAQGNVALRYHQERHLFGFFGSSFSVFEAYFYGMYAIGNTLQQGNFPLDTARDQQRVSPGSTDRAFQVAFAGDPVLTAYRAVLNDPAYAELKEVRNILTHRTAPGRTIFVSVGTDEDMPAVWKLNNITLDGRLTTARRAHVARLLAVLLDGASTFAEAKYQ